MFTVLVADIEMHSIMFKGILMILIIYLWTQYTVICVRLYQNNISSHTYFHFEIYELTCKYKYIAVAPGASISYNTNVLIITVDITVFTIM